MNSICLQARAATNIFLCLVFSCLCICGSRSAIAYADYENSCSTIERSELNKHQIALSWYRGLLQTVKLSDYTSATIPIIYLNPLRTKYVNMIPPHIPINAGGLRYGDSKAAAVFRMPDIQPLAGMFRESDRSLICPDLEGGKFSSIVYVAFMDERGDIWNAMDFKNSSEILSRVDRIVSKGSPYESRASGTSTKIFKPATVELSEIAVNDLSK